MGEGTSAARTEVLAARAQVLAAREALDEEFVRLEASARAAIDVKAKVKRNPVKSAGVVAGAGFLAVGGPKRVFRRAKRAVLGPEEPLPVSMLPKEIDAALGSLGTDGDRVRGVIEREFASYLKATEPARRSRNIGGALTIVSVAFLRPLVLRYSKHLAEQIFSTEAKEYDARLQAVRERLGVKPKEGPADEDQDPS
ncbi:MAG: hypothetical protein QG587_584 [Chloroflexota bacterium]|nr:hypothetical protein [Chloroflexota bacterium]